MEITVRHSRCEWAGNAPSRILTGGRPQCYCVAGNDASVMLELPDLRYTRPQDREEAIQALARPGAAVYAGGTDLLMAMAARRSWAAGISELVDVKGIEETRELSDSTEHLRIGSGVTAARLASSALIRRAAPGLAEAASISSSPVLRNRGTLGGNIVTPHPAGDIVTALLATNATVIVIDRNGERQLPLAEIVGSEPVRGTLILAVRVPKHGQGRFERLATRSTFGRSLVSVAASVAKGRLSVALGGMNTRPFPAIETTAAIEHGEDPASAIERESLPPNDGFATGAERVTIACALIRRAVESLDLR